MDNDSCLIGRARTDKCGARARCDICGWNREVDKKLSRELRRRGLVKGKKGLYVLKTDIRRIK